MPPGLLFAPFPLGPEAQGGVSGEEMLRAGAGLLLQGGLHQASVQTLGQGPVPGIFGPAQVAGQGASGLLPAVQVKQELGLQKAQAEPGGRLPAGPVQKLLDPGQSLFKVTLGGGVKGQAGQEVAPVRLQGQNLCQGPTLVGQADRVLGGHPEQGGDPEAQLHSLLYGPGQA